jgi:cytochrome c2
VLVDGRAQPLDPDAIAACVAAGPGYTMAFDGTTRTKSTADTVAFLQHHLDP